ncbi:MAG: hypothetical protein JXA15_13310 [Spirochaetales bacterium]|nr:hypothetical protein [Spirochaetales bacterium]
MKRFLVGVAIVLVPLALIAAVAQARAFDALRREALDLEERQKELIEENRKLVAALAALSSRERVGEAAGIDPALAPFAPEATLQIVVVPEGGRDD